MHSPIVAPETLAAWIEAGRSGLRVIDVRWYLGQPKDAGLTAYVEGHIPTAIHLDIDADLTARDGPGRHPLPDPAVFAATLAARGIGDGDLVVAYDDVGGWVAARLWWMLEDLGFGTDGHGRALVLDGGLQAWVAAGGSLTTTIPVVEPAADLHLGTSWGRVVDRDALKPRLGKVLLLDARAGPRYRGEVEPIDPRPGHIPTAVNAPVAGNLQPDGRLRDARELAESFGAMRAAAGKAGLASAARPDSPIVVSCGSGISACHTALAMRIAGLPDPILYPGSYSDWSTAGEPVAVDSDPGRFLG
ncbi:MAG: sulfurtransferase [Chloroflexota bacterium]